MRLPTETGTGLGAAEQEAARRAEDRASAGAAEPGFLQQRSGLTASSRAASTQFGGNYIDADGNAYGRWVLGVAKFSEPWRLGPKTR